MNGGSALVRFDLQLNDANDLVLRGDWHDRQQTGARVEWHGLPQSEGEGSGRGGGAMIALTSEMGNFVNDARLYRAADYFDQSGYWTLPRGLVNTTSVLPTGQVGVTSLMFGGNSSLPRWDHSSMFEASDELSWISPDASHRVKLGILVDEQSASANASSNKYGMFSYASIGDLAADHPSAFTRTLATRPQATAGSNGAVYLGDAWRPTDALAITYGVRAEWAAYGRAPAYNPAVDSAFGRRTDRYPSELQVSPRLGFSYSAGGDADRPALRLRGGVGEFRGNTRSWLFALAAGQNGLAGAEQQLTCIGASVPVPDWSQYLADPSSVPTSCVGGGGVVSSALPRVAVFAPGYGAPQAWRASLGVTKPIGRDYSLAVDALYAYGFHEQGVTDLNLNTTPQFRLADEGNRPVYVPASTIDPGTGATSSNASRLDPGFSNVLQINSALHSDTRQLVVSLEKQADMGLSYNLSYTFTRSYDQSQGFEGAEYDESTSGNPNRAEWSWNDDAREHQMLAIVSYQFNPALQLTFVGHALSGRRFTPRVRGDINGDGIQNDRAFVFDPAATTDTVLASGMRELLAAASPRTRACLERQLGTIAGRNSCTSPWRTTFDLQLNYSPAAFGLRRRLVLSVTAVNALAGLDAALHGMDHLRGWGQYARTDEHL
ncbi:MAG: TonB-dependent receptor, partial [Gemmatimonadota bacterium]|nr:TonB-dependent receptor [Gemmatimonadota bacterium]